MKQKYDWTRFEDWPPLIPKMGQTIQVQFERDGEVFETEVLFRGVSRSRRSYTIFVSWPLETDGVLGLTITQDAGPGTWSSGLSDYWLTIPKTEREKPEEVKLFV